MLCNIGLVIFALHRSVVAVYSTGVQYEKSQYNNSRISHPGLRYKLNTRSNIECGAMCEQTDKCVAFSSNQSGSCELSRYDPNDEATGTEHNSGWRMYVREKCWPNGYDGFVLNGMCYFWKQSWPRVNWDKAQADCHAQRSHLTCIGSDTADEAIAKIVTGVHFWIGIYKREGDDEFTCNGKHLTFTKWNFVVGFNRCAMVMLNLNRNWVTQRCTLSSKYVCEKRYR